MCMAEKLYDFHAVVWKFLLSSHQRLWFFNVNCFPFAVVNKVIVFVTFPPNIMFIQDLNIIINQCLIRRFLNHIRTMLIITTLSLGELIEKKFRQMGSRWLVMDVSFAKRVRFELKGLDFIFRKISWSDIFRLMKWASISLLKFQKTVMKIKCMSRFAKWINLTIGQA